MIKRSKAVLIAFPLLILAGVAIFLSCNNQECLTGSSVKNPGAYLLDIEKMNGTDLHTLELHEGDALQIRFETAKGALYMQINAPDGSVIYCGNGKETTFFTVNIPEDGVYSVVVEARHARGTIYIRCKASIRNTLAGYKRHGIQLPTQEYRFTVVLSDPHNPMTAMAGDYCGDGGIPGYIITGDAK